VEFGPVGGAQTVIPVAGLTHTVTGLSPVTQYQHRWRAIGVGGTPSAYTSPDTFYTENAVSGGGNLAPEFTLTVAGLVLTVRDEANAVVVGAAVTRTPGAIALGTTNTQGQLTLPSLAPGNYTLIATLTGGSGTGLYRVEGAPTITSQTSMTLSSGLLAGTVTATDVNGDTVTFSIVGGADAGAITITTGGALSFVSTPTNGRSYYVTVRASDGTLYTEQQITVVVDMVIVGTLKASQLDGLSNRIRWASLAKGLVDKQTSENVWLIISTTARRVSAQESLIGAPTVSVSQLSGPTATLTTADVFAHAQWVGVRVSGGALGAKHDVALTYSTDSGQTFVDHVEVTGAVA
jgi:hypothetical protein